MGHFDVGAAGAAAPRARGRDVKKAVNIIDHRRLPVRPTTTAELLFPFEEIPQTIKSLRITVLLFSISLIKRLFFHSTNSVSFLSGSQNWIRADWAYWVQYGTVLHCSWQATSNTVFVTIMAKGTRARSLPAAQARTPELHPLGVATGTAADRGRAVAVADNVTNARGALLLLLRLYSKALPELTKGSQL